MPRGKKKAEQPGIEGQKPFKALSASFTERIWQPGQSGNPSGITITYRHVKDLCKLNTVKAVKQIIKLIDSNDPRVSYAAATYVIERAVGKVRENDADTQRHRPDLAQLNPKELHTFRKLAAKMMTLPAEREPETIDAEGVEVQPTAPAVG